MSSVKSNAHLARELRRAYRLMFARFGHQNWWPGETPFEVCVGAILVQNTSWTNVGRAIVNLKAAQVLEPRALFALSETKLPASSVPRVTSTSRLAACVRFSVCWLRNLMRPCRS